MARPRDPRPEAEKARAALKRNAEMDSSTVKDVAADPAAVGDAGDLRRAWRQGARVVRDRSRSRGGWRDLAGRAGRSVRIDRRGRSGGDRSRPHETGGE